MLIDTLSRATYDRAVIAVRSAPRRLGPLARRPVGGFALLVWWTGTAGVSLIALAIASLAVGGLGPMRVLAVGVGLTALSVIVGGAAARVRLRTAILTGASLPLLLVVGSPPAGLGAGAGNRPPSGRGPRRIGHAEHAQDGGARFVIDLAASCSPTRSPL